MLRRAVKMVVPPAMRRMSRAAIEGVRAFCLHPRKADFVLNAIDTQSAAWPGPLKRTTQRLLYRRWARSPSLFRTRDADVFVLSFPKCGRTWLRVMLSKYILDLKGQEPGDLVDVYSISKRAGLPGVTFDHEDSYCTIEGACDESLETNQTRYRNRRVAFLVRDPRDVMVSYYVYCTKRAGVYQGTISQFIRDSRFGIDIYLRYLQIWEANRHVPKAYQLFRYEDLRAQDVAGFTQLLEFAGIPVDEGLVRKTVEFGSFSNMQRMEAKKEFTNNILTPSDPADTETFKVRKGKIGDYASYMSSEDIAHVEARMSQMLPGYFGYVPSIGSPGIAGLAGVLPAHAA